MARRFTTWTIVLAFPAMAQQADSLWTIWSDASRSDSVRMAALQKRAEELSAHGESDSAAVLTQLLWKHAQKVHDQYWMCRTLLDLAKNSHSEGDLQQAEAYTKKGIAIAEKIRDNKLLADHLYNSATMHQQMARYDSALLQYRQAAKILEGSGDPERYANLLNNMANVFIQQGDHEPALVIHEQLLDQAKEGHDTRKQARSLGNIGAIHLKLGNYLKAANMTEQAVALYEEIDDMRELTGQLNNLGAAFIGMGMPDLAMTKYVRALSIAEQNNDQFGVASNANGMGVLFRSMGQLDSALTYFRKSDSICIQLGLSQGRAHNLAEISRALRGLGQYDDATNAMTEALDLQTTMGDRRGMATSMSGLSEIHRAKGEHQEALRHASNALGLCREMHDPSCQADALRSKAETLLAMGRTVEGISAATAAMELARINNELGIITEITKCLFQGYEQQGDSRRALEMHKTWVALRDSVQNAENRESLVRQGLQYAYGKRLLADSLQHIGELARESNARTIAELRSSRDRDNMLAISTIFVLVLTGSSFAYRWDRRQRDARYRQQQSALQNRLLRTQMNPHFVGNAMQNVQRALNTGDNDRAQTLLAQLGELMRAVLENSASPSISLEADLQVLEQYVKFERLRTNDKFDFHKVLDAQVDPYEVHVPPMVLQPFIENAVVHGLEPKSGRGSINLTIRRRNGSLILIVEDDGVGRSISSAREQPNNSLSTRITKERLDLLQSHTGRAAGFTVTDLLQGTRVEIQIPLFQTT